MKTKIGIGLVICAMAFSGTAFSQSRSGNNNQNAQQECMQRGCKQGYMKKGQARVHANKKQQRQNGECMRNASPQSRKQDGAMHQGRHVGMNNSFKNK